MFNPNTDAPGAPEPTSGQQTDSEAEIQRLKAEMEKRDRAYRELQSDRDRRVNELTPLAEIGRQYYEAQQAQQAQQAQSYVPQGGNVEVPPGYDTARPQVLWDQYGNPVYVNQGQPAPAQRQPVSDPMLRATAEEAKREAQQARREAAEARAQIEALTQREKAVIDIQQGLVAFRQKHPEIDDDSMERLATFEKARMDELGYPKPAWERARREFFAEQAEKESEIATQKRERARSQSVPVAAPPADIPLTKKEEFDADLQRDYDQLREAWQVASENQ